MKEIETLVERADRYLKSAKLLLADGDFESSVSRTYYAIFYCAQAIVITEEEAKQTLEDNSISERTKFDLKSYVN